MINHPMIKSVAHRWTALLLIIYLFALCWILLFKLGISFSYMGNRQVNLIPFDRAFLTGENIMNAIVFIPLGIYAGLLFEKWPFVRKLGFFFLFSATIEILQYILRIGAFDVTDIITNTSGGVIGLGLYNAIQILLNNRIKTQKILNIAATIGTLLMLLLLVLLKLDMLPVKYQ